MANLPPSVMQSMVLFLLMAGGFGASKAGILKGGTLRSLSRFIVDFTLPAIIIISMQRPFSPELRNQAFRILGISSVVYAASFPLAYAAVAMYKKADVPEKGVHRFAMCFSNVGFMGFPVAASLLGHDSLFMVSIYNIPFQLLVFSVGIVMIAGRARSEGPGKQLASLKLLLNPSIFSAFIGFALFLCSARIPDPLYTALDLFGGMTTPLAMAVIGAVLAQTSIGRVLANPRIWLTTAYRLAIHPLLVLALAKALGLSGMELAVPILVSAMPVAANSTILAGVYGGDQVTASGLVFVSTTLSLATIPVVALLFH